MLRVDERCISCLGGGVELAGGSFTTGVLGSGDDLEILAFQFFVEFLPAWQIECASSPRGPGEQQHLFPAELRQFHGVALAVWQSEIGGDALAEIATANNRNFSVAPRIGNRIGHFRLAQLFGKGAEVEAVGAGEAFGYGNAKFVEAGTLRFQIETVDALEVGFGDPQAACIGERVGEWYCTVGEQNSCGWARRSEKRWGSEGSEECAPVHV